MLNLVKYRVLADTIHKGKFYARGAVIELPEDSIDNVNFQKIGEYGGATQTQSGATRTTVKK